MTRVAIIGGEEMTDFLNKRKKRSIPVTYSIRGKKIRRDVRYSVGSTESEREVVYIDRLEVPLNPMRNKDYIRPDCVDFKSYMVALNRLEVTHILSTSIVGSLNELTTKPGNIVVPSDYIDFTDTDVTIDEGKRFAGMNNSFPLRRKLLDAKNMDLGNYENGFKEEGIYVVWTRGPTFESAFEIDLIKTMLHQIRRRMPILFGMTAPAEAKLARCLDMEYGCIAVVTNHAGPKDEITTSNMKKAFEKARPRVQEILERTTDLIYG